MLARPFSRSLASMRKGELSEARTQRRARPGSGGGLVRRSASSSSTAFLPVKGGRPPSVS